MSLDEIATRATRGGGVRENQTSGTGRTPTSDPLLDRINLEMEGSGPMHMMHEADSTENRPPDALIDGCPECVYNTEAPSSVHDDSPRGWLANYVCADCGHAWTTSWGK